MEYNPCVEPSRPPCPASITIVFILYSCVNAWLPDVMIIIIEINRIKITFGLSNGIFFINFGRFGLNINAKITFTHEFETFTLHHFFKNDCFINIC
ncbi:hypothetical protein D3C86_1566520 [compost metagenome]